MLVREAVNTNFIILYDLDEVSNPKYNALELSMLTITPSMSNSQENAVPPDMTT
jgi:hypothetical protein